MTASVFSGLELTRDRAKLAVRIPAGMHDPHRARTLAGKYGVEFHEERESWSVRSLAADDLVPRPLKQLFAELGAYPPPYPELASALPSDVEPLVSCIIVVNQNALFVREQLLPSLVANTRGHRFETVLVHNGRAHSENVLAPHPGMRSVWGAVSAAYNAGAAAARGAILAFFHDDCIVDDPLWVEKCLGAFAGGAAAVAGEFRRLERIAGLPVPPLPVAKCVPLVIEAAQFQRAGGFDEFHYVGYEDLDLTLRLAQLGKRVEPVGLGVRHFDGMSSTLKYCPVRGLETLYALAAVPRIAILRRFREFIDAGARREEMVSMRLALDAQLFHVLMKYRDYLATVDAKAYARAAAQLGAELERRAGVPPAAILPRFRALDLQLRQAAA